MEKTNLINFNNIHQTARVHPGAKLGQNIIVGQYSVIGEQVEIGDNCEVGPHVALDGRTTVGRGNRFFKGSSIGSKAENLQYESEKGVLVIGDNNIFRENVVICCGTGPDGTGIGNSNLLIANSYIGPDCRLGNQTIINYCTTLTEHVVVEDRAIVSPLSEVYPYVKIGELAMIGAASKIVGNVPPFMLVDGNPALPAGMNVVGLRRHGVDSRSREVLKKAYRILYRSNLTIAEALGRIEQELQGSKEVERLISFLHSIPDGVLQ
jgi:UDP-N-acetylglucosamine acyltransferase